MSFISDARSLSPKNKIVLIEIDGTEFGADIHRIHYSPIPHSPKEIIDAANEVYDYEYLKSGKVSYSGKIESAGGIVASGESGCPTISMSGFNLSGEKYRGVRLKHRWLSKPPDDAFTIKFKNSNHDFDDANAASGYLSKYATDIGEGWYQSEIYMRNIPGWTDGELTDLQISLWNSGAGSVEIMEVALINVDADDVDPSKLRPKSIWWNGLEFGYWPFLCSGIEFSSTQQSDPTVAIANLSGVIGALCRAYDQMVNAKVRIIQTSVGFIDAKNFPDGNPDADPNESWVQLYYIDQLASEDNEACQFSLSSPLDLQGLQIPTRQVTTFCIWQSRGLYAKGLDIEEENGCTWDLNRAGIKYYDAKGDEVFDPSKDRCGGCVKDCRLRFGQLYDDPKAAKLPFGGFPASSLISS